MSVASAGRAPAADTTDAAAAAAPAKKSRKKLFIALAVVIVAVGGFVVKKDVLKPHYLPGQHVPNGIILPLAQLTVNMSDGHLVQASISLQLTSVAVTKKVEADVARFEDAANTVLGTETYATMLTPQGRAGAKAQILRACQQITGTVDGAAPQVDAVYFTGLVLQ